jgi:tRNA 5-methylaminomethyl-2-thiouridine biosynthesis bifunctional protein
VSTRFVMLATGFGAGEHVMSVWRARDAAGDTAPLHYLALLPALPDARDVAPELLDLWPVNVPGFHRMVLDQGRVTLDLLVGTLDACLPQVEARVNAFYLAQPITQMRALAKLALPGATLTLRGAGEQDLKALRSAGFEWTPADGALQDGLQDVQAVYTSRKPQPPRAAPPLRRAIVIGAGMAGAAACERLAVRGWEVTLIERHGQAAQEASGNRAGIFMPLLSKDDNIPTRLSRAAYLYAIRHWQRLGGLAPGAPLPPDTGRAGGAIAGAQCGVLQLARDAAHATLQREVAEAWNYPPEFVRWLDAPAASRLLGAPVPDGGWLFSQGGWAHPAAICRATLDACGARLTRIFHAEALQLMRQDGADGAASLWQVRAADGALLAEAPHVILANGAGARFIAQSAGLPLYTMRGQVTHLAEHDFQAPPLVVCREAYMTPPVHGIVSVGATYDSDSEASLRPASQQENLARTREILPGALHGEPPLAGRVGFRCMAPDRLPLVGALPNYDASLRMERLRDVPRHPGLHGLLGYASRGLIWAPLAAELLAAQLEGEPLPLEADLAAALDPARFLLKSRRGAQV